MSFENITEDSVDLKSELQGLFAYIQRVRQEIAAIDRPADQEHGFGSMGEQLDAIVKATEHATDSIMEAMERNEAVITELRKTITDPGQLALIEKITNNGNDVFEACSFQDITGQRVSKVVKSITYVEERVNAVVSIWGKDTMDEVEVETDHVKTADEELLNGPQLDGEGLDQAAIDALFD